MSYIRIEDEIYEVVVHNGNFTKLKKGKSTCFFNKYLKERIADKIEELCDAFVVTNVYKGNVLLFKHEYFINNGTEYGFDGAYNDFNVSRKFYKHFDTKCYGAIWTNKGLIYVAKMNDDGELELL